MLDVHSERLCDDGLVDEMLRLRGAVMFPHGHQLCWYHPGLWPELSSEPDPTSPRFVPGCVAYRSALAPGSSTATG